MRVSCAAESAVRRGRLSMRKTRSARLFLCVVLACVMTSLRAQDTPPAPDPVLSPDAVTAAPALSPDQTTPPQVLSPDAVPGAPALSPDAAGGAPVLSPDAIRAAPVLSPDAIP